MTCVPLGKVTRGPIHSTSTLLNSPETRHSICTMHNHEPASMNQRLKLPGSYSF